MKRSTIKRRILPLIFTGLATVPVAGSWGSAPALAATAKSYTYKGSTINTRWGPIQVVITLKSKKIIKVTVGDTTHTARSQILANQAIPILKQETLHAQSANIDEVSGATDISQAYIQSLQAAIKKAQQARTL